MAWRSNARPSVGRPGHGHGASEARKRSDTAAFAVRLRDWRSVVTAWCPPEPGGWSQPMPCAAPRTMTRVHEKEEGQARRSCSPDLLTMAAHRGSASSRSTPRSQTCQTRQHLPGEGARRRHGWPSQGRVRPRVGPARPPICTPPATETPRGPREKMQPGGNGGGGERAKSGWPWVLGSAEAKAVARPRGD